jgi:hypothetical protein
MASCEVGLFRRAALSEAMVFAQACFGVPAQAMASRNVNRLIKPASGEAMPRADTRFLMLNRRPTTLRS